MQNYSVSKKIPDIFDSNLNKNYQIVIIFGVNIPNTTCDQITIYISDCNLKHNYQILKIFRHKYF